MRRTVQAAASHGTLLWALLGSLIACVGFASQPGFRNDLNRALRTLRSPARPPAESLWRARQARPDPATSVVKAIYDVPSPPSAGTLFGPDATARTAVLRADWSGAAGKGAVLATLAPDAVAKGPPAGGRIMVAADPTTMWRATSPHSGPQQVQFRSPRGYARPDSEGHRLSILQIGDSHTAADFMSGEIRKRLQAEYGDGGAGYVVAGKPHPGVRSAALKVEASEGWSYKSLQSASAQPSQFTLAGFAAVATRPGATMTFTAHQPINHAVVEIEALRQPGGGSIEVDLDGAKSHYGLAGPEAEPTVIRIVPKDSASGQARSLSITTSDAKPVQIFSVGISNSRYGIAYSNVGFPGATIDIVNKMDPQRLKDDLRRLSPDIVVLAFGTNEGFNDNLDLAAYALKYRSAVRRIKDALPYAAIVVVAPPDGNRRPAHCKEPGTTCQEPLMARTSSEHGVTVPMGYRHSALSDDDPASCAWQTPPQLEPVRRAQRTIADQENLAFWNWSELMPARCGAHAWTNATPPLMSRDHVHFTAEGYRKSASGLLRVLKPIVERFRAPSYVTAQSP